MRRCQFQGESQTDGRVLVVASDLLLRRHQAEQSLSLRLLSTVRASRRRSADRRFSVVHQRTLRANRIFPCPIRVTRLACPQHRPHCRREIHASRTATGAYPVPAESHSGPSTSTGEHTRSVGVKRSVTARCGTHARTYSAGPVEKGPLQDM